MPRTSVYLSAELHARVKASGVPLGELVRRSLETDAPAAPAVKAGPAAPVTTGHPQRVVRPRCKRDGVRVIGGWCGDCQVNVERDGLLPAGAVCKRAGA